MTISVDNGRMPKKGIAVWTVAALLALNGALLAEGAGLALPGSLGTYFFGPKLVRAEVLVKDGGVLHDYRVDRGIIRAKSPGTLSVLERDGSLVSIAVAPTATITLDGRPATFSALRRPMVVTVIRDGDNPAIEVRASLK
jgi:hypothetical protein